MYIANDFKIDKMKNYFTLLLFVSIILFSSKAVGQTPPYAYVPNLITLNTIPLNSTSNIRQNLYYPSDFNAPSGMVDTIYLGAGTASSPTFTGLTIKVGPTALMTFTSGPFISGLTTVYSANVTLSAVNGWFRIPLSTPFFYSNTQNLIVEISQSGFSGSSSTPMASSSAVPSTTNRTLYGTIASGTGSVQPRLMQLGLSIVSNNNDIRGVAVIQPASNSQHCPNAPLTVRASIKNNGSLSQSNFPVNAYYSGAATGSLTTTYVGTLPAGVTDTVDFPPALFQPGNYNIKAVSKLSTDTTVNNDTTTTTSFIIKPQPATPIVFPDTVCLAGSALLQVDIQPNTTYNWYSALTGGSLVNVGSSVSFTSLAADTFMYVSSTVGGCESDRVPIQAIIGPAPVVDLGQDTSFCESIPLVLDGGNPGGQYLWSTGDTVQSIVLTNQSGAFWVAVDKYCVASDTINVTIAPRPQISGISYVRMNGTYQFSPAGGQYITTYLWYFGDGTSSTLQNPLHAYSHGQTSALNVMLIVGNECGYDTVYTNVPTSVTDIDAEADQVKVYPNPATNELNISSENGNITQVYIADISGRLVKSSSTSAVSNLKLSVADLAPGRYMVRVVTEQGQFNRKIEVIR